jgi:hypothetical protein
MKVFSPVMVAVVGMGGLLGDLLAEQPVEVAGRKQLFIDHRLIESSENVDLTMNPPRKAGIVLSADYPWESGTVGGSKVTVLTEGSVHKMWYESREEGRDGRFGPGHQAYATSTDGVHWEKPSLGVVEFQGTSTNNLVDKSRGMVFLDPKGPSQERYKNVVNWNTNDPQKGGIYIESSGDGFRWQRHDVRLFPFDCDTANQAFYDPRRKKYVAYVRLWNPLRKVGRVEYEDILQPWPFTTAPRKPGDRDRLSL